MQDKLDLIANKARQDKRMKFTSLFHHINEVNLHSCYQELKKDKACGIDGVTLESYGEALTENITLLVQKLKSKRYRPKPALRVYIPKAGKDEYRGLGIPALEDKLVQLMVKKILEPIFEANFLDCSYGFRPALSCHKAISCLNQTIMKEPVNYVVEVDIRKFFGAPGKAWCFQRVEFPSWKRSSQPTRDRVLSLWR